MHVTLRVGDDEFELYLAREGNKVKIEIDGETLEADVSEAQGHLRVTIKGTTYDIQTTGNDTVVVDGQTLPVRVESFQPGGAPGAHGAGGARGARVRPPMPGKIVGVKVNVGDEVKPGQVLVVLEAMKMQNEIASPAAGTVKEIKVQPGQSVEAKDVLVIIE